MVGQLCIERSLACDLVANWTLTSRPWHNGSGAHTHDSDWKR